jgi:hypothetical protein
LGPGEKPVAVLVIGTAYPEEGKALRGDHDVLYP